MFNQKKLRVLMYHKVSEHTADALTVTTHQLTQQLLYLQEAGYQIISLNTLLTNPSAIPERAVILTFDDGYLNNLQLAYPILQQFQAKTTIFLPTAFIGKTSAWDSNDEPLMSLAQLKGLDDELISFGLHTHNHLNFKHLTFAQIQQEINDCLQFFQETQLPFVPALAYPYGGIPTHKPLVNQMKAMLEAKGISMAFRIGNRHNTLPIRDAFAVERLDIRGTDSFEKFKRKIRWGKIF